MVGAGNPDYLTHPLYIVYTPVLLTGHCTVTNRRRWGTGFIDAIPFDGIVISPTGSGKFEDDLIYTNNRLYENNGKMPRAAQANEKNNNATPQTRRKSSIPARRSAGINAGASTSRGVSCVLFNFIKKINIS